MKKNFEWPSEKTLKKMDKKLAKAMGSLGLPENPTPVDLLKYSLCAQFIRYKRQHQITQKKLAEQVGLSEARMSEILHYHYGRYTVDLLVKALTKIKPDLKIKVA